MGSLDKQIVDAVRENKLLEVKSLLLQGASVNAKDDKGDPILLIATQQKNIILVKLLISSGATPHDGNAYQVTALIIAIRNSQDTNSALIANALLQACRGVPVPQGTITQCIVECGLGSDSIADEQADRKTSEYLGQLLGLDGINLDERESESESNDATLLHILVAQKYYQSATLLINHGASPSSKDKNGRTPAHYIAKIGRYAMDEGEGGQDWEDVEFSRSEFNLLQLMLQNGANLSDKDVNGVTVRELLQERIPVPVLLSNLVMQ